jgi:hypothetical protein
MSPCVAASLCCFLLTPLLSGAVELKPKTVEAWEAYWRKATAAMRARLDSGGPFLAIDQWPERSARVRNGEIVVWPESSIGRIEVPGGLIHHWTAAALIPGATRENVLAVVQSYGRYKKYYQPTITASKEISCAGEEQQFSVRLIKKVLFVTTALDIESSVRQFRETEKQSYSFAWSTRIREIENQGSSGEHLLDPGLGSGYIWRVASISRFEQRDNGVYVEVEVVLLSRDISATAMWLVKPVVTRLSRSAVSTLLEQTRKAVHSGDAADRPDGCATVATRAGAQ